MAILGVIIALRFLLSYKSNPYSNWYIIIIFSLASLRVLHKGVFEIYNPTLYQNSIEWLNPFFMVIIPSFYLYFKTILNNKQYQYQELFHFTYPLLIILLFFLNKNYLLFSEDFLDFMKFERTLLFILIYLILSYDLLNNEIWKKKELQIGLGKRYKLLKNWTQFFFTIFLLLMINLIFSLYIENNTNEKLTGYFIIPVNLVIWIIIFIKILKHPEIMYGFDRLEKRIANYSYSETIDPIIWKLSVDTIKNSQEQKLSKVIKIKIKEYIEEIEVFVEHSKPFRDVTFKMNDLGNALNIPRSHLAYLFKHHCKIPFVSYCKYCKIKDAQTLIKEKYLRTNTLETLSKKVGFISYNTFFISFKKQCGISPNKSM